MCQSQNCTSLHVCDRAPRGQDVSIGVGLMDHHLTKNMRWMEVMVNDHSIKDQMVLKCLTYVFVLSFSMRFRLLFCGEQGEELRKMVGAAGYVECSSKTQQV